MVIDLERLDPSVLPVEVAISSLTLAELAAGPHATDDPDERARRQDRLQRAEAAFDPLPFDAEAARAYGRILAATAAAWRNAARGPSGRPADRRHRLRRQTAALHPQPRRLQCPRAPGRGRQRLMVPAPSLGPARRRPDILGR
jgi:hypothetical protein